LNYTLRGEFKVPWGEFTWRLLAAALFGALIGVERQWRQRRAGLRTNALVSIGSAAFVTVSSMMPGDNSSTRIAGQVVSGIGFLGAGVILREGLNVRGLNSAATLWCAAAVGTLAGLGFITPSFIAALMILGTNVLLRPLVLRIGQQRGALELPVCYRIQAMCMPKDEEHVRSLLMDFTTTDDSMLLKAIRSEPTDESNKAVSVQADVIAPSQHDRHIEAVINRLNKQRGITGLSWELLGDEEVVCSLE
jgi:putative Mg2+ transporter-C (MgtC) family protein